MTDRDRTIGRALRSIMRETNASVQDIARIAHTSDARVESELDGYEALTNDQRVRIVIYALRNELLDDALDLVQGWRL